MRMDISGPPGVQLLSSQLEASFKSGKLENCSEIIEKLSILKPNDPRVLMNKALIQFIFKSDCTHSQQYLSELQNIATHAKIALNLPASTNQTDVSFNHTAESATVKTESCTPDAPTPNQLADPSYVIVLKYNYALVLFYRRQYVQAERILSECLGVESNGPLRSNPILPHTVHFPCMNVHLVNVASTTDLTICRRVILLWLEILILMQRSDTVYALCSYWLTLISSAASVTGLSMNTPVSLTRPIPSPELQTSGSSVIHTLIGIQRPLRLFYIRSCLLTGRIRDAENECSMITAEIERVNDSTSQDLLESVETTDESCDPTNCESPVMSQLLSDDLKKSNDEDHEVWNTGNCIHFLRAHLAYLKGQHSEAIQLLAKVAGPFDAPSERVRRESVLISNNLGLVHHRAGQFNISGLHLKRALRLSEDLVRTSVPSLPTDNKEDLLNQVPLKAFSVGQHHAILYNLGLQQLFSRRPSKAFSALIQLVRTYPANPRLWFRLAECCIKTYCPNNLSLWQSDSRRQVSFQPVGEGPSRKLVLMKEAQNVSCESPLGSKTLEFASMCLRNARVLLPRPPRSQLELQCFGSDERGQWNSLVNWSNSFTVQVLPSPIPLHGLGLLHVISAVHLAMTYTALCLDHPFDALHAAKLLLPDCVPLTTDNATIGTQDATSASGTYGTEDSLSGSIALNQNPMPPMGTVFGAVVPLAYRFLTRIYYAEALIALNRVNEAITLFFSCLPDSPVDKTDFPRILDKLAPTSFSLPCLQPPLHSLQSSTISNNFDALKKEASVSTACGSIYPLDFPATTSQAAGLLLYNLAATLAIDRQWTSAELYLKLSLPALSLPMELLDGRKWWTSIIPTSSVPQSVILPVPCLMLQLYLHLVLNRRERALEFIRETFGDSALSHRINHPPKTATATDELSNGIGVSDSLPKDSRFAISEAYQLSKFYASNSITAISDSVPSNVNQNTNPQGHLSSGAMRPNNLWAPNQQQQQQLQHYAQHLMGPPDLTQNFCFPPFQQTQSPIQSNVQFGARWEQSQPTTPAVAPNMHYATTGLITAANESDWPPL